MIKSMTGYGRGNAEAENISFQVEIKAVNHRYADIGVKGPRSILPFENDLKKSVGGVLKRGKIDLFITQENLGGGNVSPVLNEALAAAYVEVFQDMKDRFPVEGGIPLELLAGQKDVVQLADLSVAEEVVRACLWSALEEALGAMVAMRQREGKDMAKDMLSRLDACQEMITKAESRAPQVVTEWQQKLTERVEKRSAEIAVDPQRLAQEIAVFADRCDITEEITRFHSHAAQFRDLMNTEESVGRKLDFIVQELNREVNTMGSKANDADLTRLVVDIKAELEKIREQVQNIE